MAVSEADVRLLIAEAVDASEGRVAVAIGAAVRAYQDRPAIERGVPAVAWGTIVGINADAGYADVLLDGDTDTIGVTLTGDLTGGTTGGGGTNFWSYSSGTLQPDPATTTPLDNFEVPVSATGAATIFTDGDSATFGIANLYAALVVDGRNNLVIQEHSLVGHVEDGSGASATLDLEDGGSFSLTADDGTNQRTVATGNDRLDLLAETGAVFGRLSLYEAGRFWLRCDDGDQSSYIDANSAGLEIASANVSTGKTGIITFDDDSLTVGMLDSPIHGYADFDTTRTRLAFDDGVGGYSDINIGNDSIAYSADIHMISGHIGTDQSASATGPVGTVVNKIPIYDNSNSLLGYIPVYNTIT